MFDNGNYNGIIYVIFGDWVLLLSIIFSTKSNLEFLGSGAFVDPC